MSLVGNLEDLGLGEILQILSLSGKSGVLRLKSKTGEGQLLFKRGLIRSAQLRQGPVDLIDLIERAGLAQGAALETLRTRVHGGASLEEAVLASDLLDAEGLEKLRREHIENTVLAMFSWSSGDFSFVVADRGLRQMERGGLLLTPGINAQFLALEGTRLRDEGAEASDAELEVLAEAALAEPEGAEGEASGALLDAVPVTCGADSVRVSAPVVAIDPELPMLEWIKGALEELQTRVHVFQRSEQAINRIRQYLTRAERPLVLLSTETPADPVSGAANWAEISARLRAQVPQLRVVLLANPDAEVLEPPAGGEPDARSEKPRPKTLFDPRASEQRAALAEALRGAVRSAAQRGGRRS